MKVKFKYGIITYSGTLDEMSYGSFRQHTLCIGRKYVKPAPTEQNAIMGAIMKNLSKIYAEADGGYIQDLGVYAVRNGKQNVPKGQLIPTRYAIFVKMMFAWQESDPEFVDLSAVTIEDIVTHEAPVISVKDAVDADLLARVMDYDELDSEIG